MKYINKHMYMQTDFSIGPTVLAQKILVNSISIQLSINLWEWNTKLAP